MLQIILNWGLKNSLIALGRFRVYLRVEHAKSWEMKIENMVLNDNKNVLMSYTWLNLLISQSNYTFEQAIAFPLLAVLADGNKNVL